MNLHSLYKEPVNPTIRVIAFLRCNFATQAMALQVHLDMACFKIQIPSHYDWHVLSKSYNAEKILYFTVSPPPPLNYFNSPCLALNDIDNGGTQGRIVLGGGGGRCHVYGRQHLITCVRSSSIYSIHCTSLHYEPYRVHVGIPCPKGFPYTYSGA